MTRSVRTIVSGGQTGADRGALDAAMALGLATGGWVPRGRRSEDGSVPARYRGMRETEERAYEVRTRRNVRDSDATLILSHGPISGGSELTRRFAGEQGRPCLHVDLEARGERAVDDVRRWLEGVRPETLNVAGPRASGDPDIEAATRSLLEAVLG